ncbi:lysophospholipid acyltransferase family protein [Sphingomonas morindae]|uniref:1-acyl-sn-glycerol-3-phosphate acyltransferase n=1 Tax=Sphingomonas morindae TaxID=1541170 RepID=A0ABY4X5S2_9SPHN|nr:lysophospholipid acyltransferase family protein [Sphingomonas morindae]USI72237.1 1-acyl-sn-glycerol-3-phosphate acyltransferase [Sphingomonas morindae]
MTRLRSALYTLAFVLLTTVMVLIGVPIALASRRLFSRYARLWARLAGGLARAVLGVRLVVEGAAPTAPVLIAAKHESAYETLAMMRLLDDPVVVLKRSILAVPVFGWLARRHGVVPVDRSANATALRAMLRAADTAKASGRAVLIFPEGTRVAPGARPPVQAGFAGLYGRLGLPVVPVATDAGRIWGKGLAKRSGPVRIRFGEAIPPGLPRREIEARVHAAINQLNG